ncbi:uncharacterized protein LOC135367939 [Ornithodoros turicata]|uniref:uncharacterized protein LOC135367939 n=1 Tax=Ornithodoros turicata TaxID=34597 RepID=UPI003138D95B
MIVLHYRDYGLSSLEERSYRGALCKFGVGLTLAFIGLTVCFSHLVAGVVCLSCGLIILAIPVQYLSPQGPSSPAPCTSPLILMDKPPDLLLDQVPVVAQREQAAEQPFQMATDKPPPPLLRQQGFSQADDDEPIYGDVDKMDSVSLVHQYIDRMGSLSTEREPSWHSLYLSLSEEHEAHDTQEDREKRS